MFWSLVKKGPIPNKASATLLIGLAHLVLNLDIFYRHLLKKLLLEQGNILAWPNVKPELCQEVMLEHRKLHRDLKVLQTFLAKS